MVIHFHPFVLGGADGVRASNICKNFSSHISDEVIEVEFYPMNKYFDSQKKAKLTLCSSVVKKYRFPQFPFESRSKFLDGLNSLWKSLVILVISLIYKPNVVVGEYSIASDSLKLLKRFKHVKTVIDMHGAVPEERAYSNSNISPNYIKRLELKEKNSSIIADYIICQSHQMKKHIIGKYGADPNKIFVYNCGVDTTIFHYSPDIRKKIRGKMGYNDSNIVFVYAGGASIWQKLPEMIQLFEEIHQNNNLAKLLILTNDKDEFSKLLNNTYSNIKNDVSILSLPFKEVNDYLNAADIGMLLRDDVVLNRVASPTKLAEYMACGLYVIVESVAKFWLDKEGQEFLLFSEKLNYANMIFSDNQRKEIAKYANDSLSLAIDNNNIKSLVSLFK